MSMCDQDTIQASEAKTGSEDLPLRTLAAVDQKTLVSKTDHLR